MSDSSQLLAEMYSAAELERELRRHFGLPAGDQTHADRHAAQAELDADERELLRSAPLVSARDYHAYRLFQETAGRDGYALPQ